MLDGIDKQIISLLLEDSQITNIQIAKKIKRSESTVRQRVVKLISNGVIRKFSIVIDPNIIGYSTIAYLGINVQPGRLLKILKILAKIEEIVSIATTTGDYMIVCEIWTKKGENLATTIEKIEEIDGIIEVLPSIIQEFHKISSIKI